MAGFLGTLAGLLSSKTEKGNFQIEEQLTWRQELEGDILELLKGVGLQDKFQEMMNKVPVGDRLVIFTKRETIRSYIKKNGNHPEEWTFVKSVNYFNQLPESQKTPTPIQFFIMSLPDWVHSIPHVGDLVSATLDETMRDQSKKCTTKKRKRRKFIE